MKKNLKNLIITLLTMPAISLSAIAGVDYDAGMNAYNKGNYDFAKTLFKKAIQVNYYDVNARYMYCQILVKEQKYDEAKQEYYKIISIAPDSQAAILSKQGIGNIDNYKQRIANQQQQTTQNTTEKTDNSSAKKEEKEPVVTATEYVKNAYRGGKKYLRPRGMTRVYIKPDENFKSMMQDAYYEWQDALGSSVMFSFSGNEQDANDVVSFEKNAGGERSQEGGYCSYNIDGTTLKGNRIVIRAYDSEGKPFPKAMVYHTMLHEIGHSIGIMGHSPYKGDIMSQGTTKFLPHLSERDKNTARLLYQNYGKQPDAEEIKKAKTEELTDIAKRIPNDPSSLIDLGDEAMAAKEYNKALNYYIQAEKIRANTNIYFKEAIAYDKIGDTDNVAACYKKIIALDKNNKTALNNLLVIYQKQGRYREAKKFLDALLEMNPALAKDPDVAKLKEVFSEKNVQTIEARQNLLRNMGM